MTHSPKRMGIPGHWRHSYDANPRHNSGDLLSAAKKESDKEEMITMAPFLTDPASGDRTSLIRMLEKDVAEWATRGTKEARIELVSAIVNEVMTSQREAIAAMLTPESLAKDVHEGIVQAIGHMVTAALKK